MFLGGLSTGAGGCMVFWQMVTPTSPAGHTMADSPERGAASQPDASFSSGHSSPRGQPDGPIAPPGPPSSPPSSARRGAAAPEPPPAFTQRRRPRVMEEAIDECLDGLLDMVPRHELFPPFVDMQPKEMYSFFSLRAHEFFGLMFADDTPLPRKVGPCANPRRRGRRVLWVVGFRALRRLVSIFLGPL